MRIEEVEEILRLHPYLPKPKFVYMVDERVIADLDGALAVVRGATPKWRRDTIVLTPDSGHDTVVHEILHTMGFGEVVANVLGGRIAKLRRLIPPLVKDEVKYEYLHSPNPKVKIYRRVK